MPLYRAREELIEKGYIRYEKGKGREAGTYTIIKIELYEKTEEGDYNLVPNMGNKGKHNEVLCNSLCNSLRPNMGTLNKQRQNNKHKEKKYIKKEMLENENKNNILLLNNNLDNNKPATYWTRSWQEKGDFKEINLGPLGVTPKTNKNQIKEEKKEYRETVKLTEIEYNTLLNKLGEYKLNRALEVLNIYKLTSGRNYKSDYHIILNGWVLKRVEDDIKKEQLKKNMIATQAIIQPRKQRKYEDFETFDYLMYQ